MATVCMCSWVSFKIGMRIMELRSFVNNNTTSRRLKVKHYLGRETCNALMKTKYLGLLDVVTHNSLRNNVRYIQTISKVCRTTCQQESLSLLFHLFYSAFFFFMTLKVINLKVFFSLDVEREESVNNTTHLEIVITPNPFDIKPLLLLPANLMSP